MASFRRDKTPYERGQDEITPRKKKTKRRHAKRRKNDKIKVSNGVFSHGVYSIFFRTEISSFRVAGFVFSHGVISSFRLFAWRFSAFSSFCMASFRVASFRRENMKRRNGTNWPPYETMIQSNPTSCPQNQKGRSTHKKPLMINFTKNKHSPPNEQY